MKIIILWLGAAACSSPTSTGFQIVAAGDGPLTAVAGDAIQLQVVEGFSDGSHQDLPSGAVVTWTSPVTVTALPADSTAASPIPAFGAQPTAIFVSNALRPDRAATLEDVVFVVDAGTSGGSTNLAATISGTVSATTSASLAVGAVPVGNAAHGATLYSIGCGSCHGATAAGSPPDPSGATFTLDMKQYPYPAPGLDNTPDDVAGDPDWTPGLLAMAARADIDNGGLVLRTPMVDWLTTPVSDDLLTAQDFSDIYAFLKTQHP